MHVLALYLSGLTPAETVAQVAPAKPTGRTVDADEAMSGQRDEFVYAASANGWGQVWTPLLDLVEDYEPEEGSALLAMFTSVSNVYGFRYFEDGQFRRQIIYMDGEVVLEEGEPLPVEASITFPDWGPDEDFVWEVAGSVTGDRPQSELPYEEFRLA